MIRVLARLFRLRLALLNGVAAVAGCLLGSTAPGQQILTASFCGVVLLASAGSALNQVLERDLDGLMLRTRQRPLPQNELTATVAVLLGTVAACAGCLLLAAAGGPAPALFGMFALCWYLVVYTPLKRRTSWALAIGAVCGAMPPVIGWCATGGDPLDFRIMILSGLIYLWQIPHFWLFQRRHAADYRRAGIPLVAAGIEGSAPPQLFRLWIVALIAAAMLLPALGIIAPPAALWYAAFPVPLVLLLLIRSEKILFSYLNLFPLLVTMALYFRQ